MAVDKEAISLLRVYSYYSKCRHLYYYIDVKYVQHTATWYYEDMILLLQMITSYCRRA